MKQVTIIIAIALGLFSCKKEQTHYPAPVTKPQPVIQVFNQDHDSTIIDSIQINGRAANIITDSTIQVHYPFIAVGFKLDNYPLTGGHNTIILSGTTDSAANISVYVHHVKTGEKLAYVGTNSDNTYYIELGGEDSRIDFKLNLQDGIQVPIISINN